MEMDTALAISVISLISTVALVIITWHYARSTHRMLKQMRAQARIQAISAEIATLNKGSSSRSGSASSERVQTLLEELQSLSKE
jgi:hypothetical protein